MDDSKNNIDESAIDYKFKIKFWYDKLQDSLYAGDYLNAKIASETLGYYIEKQIEVELNQ